MAMNTIKHKSEYKCQTAAALYLDKKVKVKAIIEKQ